MKGGKYFDWDPAKNLWLKEKRGLCFDDILPTLESHNYVAIIPHPNPNRYPNQKMYIVEIEEYIYLIPHVDDGNKIFLKTIFASRRMTEIYKNKKK